MCHDRNCRVGGTKALMCWYFGMLVQGAKLCHDIANFLPFLQYQKFSAKVLDIYESCNEGSETSTYYILSSSICTFFQCVHYC